MQIIEAPIKATDSPTVPPATLTLPDHKQLPDSDGTFVKNFQEHPQSIVLTSSITPILEKLHPDGRYCIGQDSGIYWRLMEPPEKGAEAPDWFYVPNVLPMLDGEYRRSYVLWKEYVAPLIAIEFVSGNGAEERDTTPPSETEKAGKFWVYEQAIRIPFYVIFDGFRDNIEAYQLINGRYAKMQPNQRGHYSILPMGVELGMILENGVSWLRWWDESGNLLLTGDERAIAEKQARLNAEAIADQQKAIAEQAALAQQQAEAIADQERQQKEKLANYLRSIGVDPDTLK
ncbi:MULTISPECIES: Uma2 family endonuclease [Pseudanabaena]|jgi:Uma2 family endonuclease|uniref:Uma2 family endonuclease n=1 Tax=Pseudanabaena TaxID=1152 RepID=UPI00247A8D6E|nr:MULTISPECIES: Uma2 family endonuclease [Pseudanabaena]MEA5489049.1 Uma2 family endonuclease [Pseudanabaena sp. CCNP1317]WGS73113.1 Uma2 family endonuclease [Pseudanabaena galeata CCNP1313]